MGQHGLPDKVSIDKCGANATALDSLKEEFQSEIEIRQIKYLNNMIEQDHRDVKRIVRFMLGFKGFRLSPSCFTWHRAQAYDQKATNGDD